MIAHTRNFRLLGELECGGSGCGDRNTGPGGLHVAADGVEPVADYRAGQQALLGDRIMGRFRRRGSEHSIDAVIVQKYPVIGARRSWFGQVRDFL